MNREAKVAAQRDGLQVFLVDLGEGRACIVDVERELYSSPYEMNSLLLRGHWVTPKLGDAADAALKLAAGVQGPASGYPIDKLGNIMGPEFWDKDRLPSLDEVRASHSPGWVDKLLSQARAARPPKSKKDDH